MVWARPRTSRLNDTEVHDEAEQVLVDCCNGLWLVMCHVWQIKHRFRDDAMADDLDVSGLRLDGMPNVETPTVINMDQSDVGHALFSFARLYNSSILTNVMYCVEMEPTHTVCPFNNKSSWISSKVILLEK